MVLLEIASHSQACYDKKPHGDAGTRRGRLRVSAGHRGPTVRGPRTDRHLHPAGADTCDGGRRRLYRLPPTARALSRELVEPAPAPSPPRRKSPRHSSGGAFRLTALPAGCLCPIGTLLTSCHGRSSARWRSRCDAGFARVCQILSGTVSRSPDLRARIVPFAPRRGVRRRCIAAERGCGAVTHSPRVRSSRLVRQASCCLMAPSPVSVRRGVPPPRAPTGRGLPSARSGSSRYRPSRCGTVGSRPSRRALPTR